MYISNGWTDYALLDCGDGNRLERWGKHILIRPDPQAIWPPAQPRLWQRPDAIYHRSSSGGGKWEIISLPERWLVRYGDLGFQVKPTSFKHTGAFPEQGANWDFITQKIKSCNKRPSILNLFAYTGGATLAAAAAGAEVCHVDAARGMVTWAKENAAISGLEAAPIRYIVDDCIKFIRREIKRGRRYDGIIMDPPSYGRGPSGEIWRFEDQAAQLVDLCAKLLSNDPLFVVMSSYTTGISPSVPAYMFNTALSPGLGGKVEAGELGLTVQSTGLFLPCGHTCRWSAD